MPEAFLLDEDAALKAKLQGIQVPPASATVPVYFARPETEDRRFVTPSITIDLVNIEVAHEREHRGAFYSDVFFSATPQATPQSTPQATPQQIGQMTFSEFPIPYNIDYQVTTYTRNAQQDRSLQAQLRAPNRIPDRFGWLEVGSGASATTRRLDSLGWLSSDTYEGDKRVFRKVHSVRVSSHLRLDQVLPIYEVLDVDINLYDLLNPSYS